MASGNEPSIGVLSAIFVLLILSVVGVVYGTYLAFTGDGEAIQMSILFGFVAVVSYAYLDFYLPEARTDG